MVYIKSQNQIAKIKHAASVWKKVKQVLIKHAKVGVSLKQLDLIAYHETKKHDCDAPFYLYKGFKGYNCISVNEVLIHGTPNEYVLKENDLVTFDVGVSYDNYICDAAFSIVLGDNKAAKKIDNATYNTLMNAIKVIKPNNYVGDISYTINRCAKEYGYEVIKDFGGHGCGLKLHEDPIILNYGKPQTGIKLKPNMVLCIEPMLLSESDRYYIGKDNWSVIASNHKLTCHYEHMVLVTNTGYEILTE